MFLLSGVSKLVPLCLQFRDGDWLSWREVGIEELFGLEYGSITDTTVKAVADLLGPALYEASRMGNLTQDEIRLVTPCLTLFNSGSLMTKYLSDLRLYIEACVASAKSGRPIEFLVTDDHRFFRGFVYSNISEGVLQKEVMAVMNLHKAVRVKLAGEIIPGV